MLHGPRRRERRFPPRVGTVPRVVHHLERGVRRPLQRVVLPVRPPFLDLPDFGADADQRFAEPVEFLAGLALRRLDHQRAGHREGHGGRVEPVVHQAFGDVLHADSGGGAERPAVEDELVRHPAPRPPVEQRVVRGEPVRHVVRREDRDFAGFAQAVRPHHADVGPGDRQDRRAAVRRGGHRAHPPGVPRLRRPLRMPRQERRQLGGAGHRPHSRPAAAVRDAEGLVQVDVADIGAELGGRGESHLRVQVRPVQIDPRPGLPRQPAHLGDALLEDAVRRGVGDHERPGPARVRGQLRRQVVERDVPAGGGRDRLHPVAGERRAGRVRPVRRGGDEADIALPVAPALVERPDHQQPGELALRAGVRLEADRGEPGDLRQPGLEVAVDAVVAGGLFRRRERVDVGEAGPGHRDHLRGRVQLHGARAERDHRGGQRQVAGLQPVEPAQHLVLGAVLVEDIVVEEHAPPPERVGQLLRLGRFKQRLDGVRPRVSLRPGGALRPGGERREHRPHFRRPGRLVEGHRDFPFRRAAEVHPPRVGGGGDPLRGVRPDRDRERVEHRLPDAAGIPGIPDGEPQPPEPLPERQREPPRAPRDPHQPLRPVPDRVGGGHQRREHLGGADVARRPVAADVLLPGLHRQPEARPPLGVPRDADHPAGHPPGVLLPGGEERGMRPAGAHRHPEPLRRPHGDVRAELPRRGEQRERQQVGRRHQQRPGLVEPVGQRPEVPDPPARVRVLDERPGDFPGDLRSAGGVGQRPLHQPDAGSPGAGPHHRQRLRVGLRVGQEHRAAAPRRGVAHRHRLGGGGRLVEQRRPGDRQPGEVRGERLEVHQDLQPPLRDLGLVGRVLGVPTGILQQVPQDHRGGDRPVVAAPDEVRPRPVPLGDPAEFRQQRRFGKRRRDGERPVPPDGFRHRFRDQFLPRSEAEFVEHPRLLGGARPDVPPDERGGPVGKPRRGLSRRAPAPGGSGRALRRREGQVGRHRRKGTGRTVNRPRRRRTRRRRRR